MDYIFLVLFWSACITIIGWSVLRIVIYRDCFDSLSERFALSYCTGLAVVSLEMAFLAFFGVGFSIPSTLIFFLPMISIAAFLDRKKLRNFSKNKALRAEARSFHSSARNPAPLIPAFKGALLGRRDKISFNLKGLPFLEKFFISAISFEIAYAFFRTFIKPMESYDGIAIYALKAKIFYLAKTIPANFFRDFAAFVPHIEYPLLIPLAETSFYVFLGSLNDLLVKMIFPLYYTALVLIFYSVSHRFLNRRGSLFFTFLLATIPQVTDFATNGYADIPFAFYCSASFFYLYLWLRQKEGPFLVLSIILSVFAVWTKAEGLLFAAVNSAVVIICMIKEKRASVKEILYVTMSMIVVVAYVLVWRSLGLEVNTDFAPSGSSALAKIITGLSRIPAILYEYQIQFFGPKKWNIIWVIFIAGFVLKFKKIFSKELMPLTAALILVFAGYSFVYMLSSAPQGFGWHLSTSGSRLFIHFVPIAVLWLALLFKELKLEV